MYLPLTITYDLLVEDPSSLIFEVLGDYYGDLSRAPYEFQWLNPGQGEWDYYGVLYQLRTLLLWAPA